MGSWSSPSLRREFLIPVKWVSQEGNNNWFPLRCGGKPHMWSGRNANIRADVKCGIIVLQTLHFSKNGTKQPGGSGVMEGTSWEEIFVFVTDPQAEVWISLFLCEAELLFLLKHLCILKENKLSVCVCVCVRARARTCLTKNVRSCFMRLANSWQISHENTLRWFCMTYQATTTGPPIVSPGSVPRVIQSSSLMVYHNKRVIWTALKLFLAPTLP